MLPEELERPILRRAKGYTSLSIPALRVNARKKLEIQAASFSVRSSEWRRQVATHLVQLQQEPEKETALLKTSAALPSFPSPCNSEASFPLFPPIHLLCPTYFPTNPKKRSCNPFSASYNLLLGLPMGC
jgi:hypothetical protein